MNSDLLRASGLLQCRPPYVRPGYSAFMTWLASESRAVRGGSVEPTVNYRGSISGDGKTPSTPSSQRSIAGSAKYATVEWVASGISWYVTSIP